MYGREQGIPAACNQRICLPVFWILGLLVFGIHAASQEQSCHSEAASIPSRPTVASATGLTQCGVTELEYGLERHTAESREIAAIRSYRRSWEN